MSFLQKYHCLNCGEEFEIEILTEEEAREARKRGQHLEQVNCPVCNRADLRKEAA